ncbi:MAG: arabinofuranan 3-O-arabinosyltransferase [Thermoleophilaceae bacterium]|nr:arabinofuranan 3-O-arabinosyltransferase [Thermoleophilaceae bacterium]
MALPLGLAAAAYALALVQRPGWATSDTKIDLHVDPVGFLSDVASVWTPTGSLGHVQGGQYSGYLWPMAPFFALGHWIGLSPWLVQRLWLGTLLAIAAWGVVRLMDALLERERGAAHLVGGALILLNPYVVVFTNRTSITLLGYAALPWMLLAVHRGQRRPRNWWWPAAFALIVASTGGGVNAAVTAWLLLAPVLLFVYEVAAGGVVWRDARAFAWRTAVSTAAASIWWVVPVVVHAGYGIDFLKFTEQAGSIWGTTSLPESLRLMGYWPSYLGVGYGDTLRPYFGDSGTLLFDPVVVTASLLVPALALTGYVWTRRWRYGPFFLLLLLVGLLVMTVGFPEGTPLRRAATFTYNHFSAVQFLRTTYKAGPLVAISVACLGGAGAGALWRRLGPGWRLPAAVAGAALVALAAWPMVQGRAIDKQVSWKKIPSAWKDTARDLDARKASATRAVVLPGQPFAFYRWGATIDPILPALADRPVAVRNVPPYADLHAVDMLWTVDNRVQQQRLLPGELAPMLDLLGAGSVVTATDDDFTRSGAMPPAEAARVLTAQGLGAPTRAYGPVRRFAPPRDSLDPTVPLPDVRRYDRRSARPLVRIEPAGGAAVVDGSAEGVATLAASRALRPRAVLRYAGDLGAAAIRAEAARGGEVVVTDSNRRRVFVASRSRQSVGPTLAASEEPPANAAMLDPFARGPDAQTVAVYRGARYVTAPASPQIAQFPEQRPYAAFDGDPSTYWLADPTLEDARHWVEVGLPSRRDVPFISVLPHVDPRVTPTEVEVGGRRFKVHPGWNKLAVNLRGVDSVRVTITAPSVGGGLSSTAGGFDEVRVPGLHVRELLRPPVLAERALAGRDLTSTPLAYSFLRTTADDPFRRNAIPPEPPRKGDRAEAEAALVRGAEDPERGIDRLFSPPAARSWTAEALASVAPGAPDGAIDRLAGAHLGGVSFASSGRFEGRPGLRASSAFDGDARTAWIAPWESGRPTWLEWRTAARRTLRRLQIVRAPGRAQTPLVVRLSAGATQTDPIAVRAGGLIDLPAPLSGRRFRLEVLDAGMGGVTPPPAVAIGELRGAGVPQVSVPRGGAVRARCGALSGSAGGRPLALRPRGTVQALDAGRPLRAASCGAPLALPAGEQELHVRAGVLRADTLLLRSAAPNPVLRAAALPGRVIDPGTEGRGSRDGVRVQVASPSWLVLGESYNRGWRAKCGGRSLGAPSVIDGYANGWRVAPGCRSVSFAFAPQGAVSAGFVIGGLACLALLLLLVLRRPRPAPERPAPAPIEGGDEAAPWPLRSALAAGVLAGAAFSFAFALRAGVFIGPAVALILWRGVSPRLLVVAAGALLGVVVPVLYLLFPVQDKGGYNNDFALDTLGAHWVAVAAFALLVLALARSLSTATRPSGARAAARADEAAPPARP